MKTKTINKMMIIAALSGLLFVSCSSDAVEAGEKKESAQASEHSITYRVNTSESELHWHGKKLAYGHSGLITISSGSLSMEADKLSAGKFEIDMKTIKETGENIDPEKASQLEGHLMSADFFDVEKFPLSTFEITAAEKNADGTYKISGNLTIKGITKNIEFPATIQTTGDKLMAQAEFTINRTNWDIKYGSGISGAVGDMVISDDITFKVILKADKQL
jgi:polyisoprenoid-binding protein YceI